MTAVIRTESQKAMLRYVVARHAQGLGWVPADDLLGHGRPYDRARTETALIMAGMMERTSDGAVYAYRATPAGVEWVDRDRLRDSLGRRRGGPQGSAVYPEVIARARRLLAEGRPDGSGPYKMREIAKLVGLSPHTLSMQLYPQRHRRWLEQRRANYKKGQ